VLDVDEEGAGESTVPLDTVSDILVFSIEGDFIARGTKI
jgi:hypothetical protein